MIKKHYYNLRQAIQYKSKTKPFPFVISHECDEKYYNKRAGEEQVRQREYFAFDDIEHFLSVRNCYPHAHEVIFDRFADNQQGRLMFDFDFDERWWGHSKVGLFVKPDFEQDIQNFVIKVFETFYIDVDVSKFVFVWLISDTEKKWSKHLIIKNAYFAENWKVQTQTFYSLMLGIISKQDPYPFGRLPIDKIIDTQIARTNATMRMCGSSKLNGKVLKLESPPQANFYDTLIQLYRTEDLKTEQHIYDRDLDKKKLDQIYYKDEKSDPVLKKPYLRKACELAEIDLTKLTPKYSSNQIENEEVLKAYKLFENYYIKTTEKEQDVFHVGNVKGSMITLIRDRPAECLLSGRRHDNSDAYLTIHKNDNSRRKCKNVYFHCFRDCDKDGNTKISLGYFL